MSRSQMQHSFSDVPAMVFPRSQFRRNRAIKTAFYAGDLIPFFFDEVLPGDTWSVSFDAFIRMASALIKPIMDNMYMDIHYWYCPNRLVHNMAVSTGGWERIQGQQENPGDSVDHLTPIINNAGGWFATTNSIFDYFGIPVGVQNLEVCSYMFRAYNMIWDKNYRDQNLQNGTGTVYGDGPDSPGQFLVRQRGKRHDYFTSCNLWPQKGTAIPLPLGTSAPVIGTFTGPDVDVIDNIRFSETAGGTPRAIGIGAANPGPLDIVNPGAGAGTMHNEIPAAGLTFDLTGQSVTADLTAATSVSLNVFREAVVANQILELDARSGTRYTEGLEARWGVTSPDGRLQNPEFLGGGTVRINSHPVQQTSATGGGSAQGNLAAFVTASTSGVGFTRSFTEHGVMMGLVSVRTDLTYQQGLPRMYSRRSRADFYEPITAHLGEQAVLNREIFADGSSADTDVFGYIGRWDEYRYGHSLITGVMRSNVTAGFASLDVYHLAQDFASLPALGASFIVEAPPVGRVEAVPTEVDFLMDGFVNVTTARVMPTYGVPGLTRI